MGKRLSRDGISDQTELLLQDSQEVISAMMESRSRTTRPRRIIGVCLLLTLAGIVYLGYFCPDHVCALTNRGDIKESSPRITDDFPPVGAAFPPVEAPENKIGIIQSRSGFRLQSVSLDNSAYENLLANNSFQFDINSHDVIVFLHIQKTGGTMFGKHLVRDLDLQRPCTCQRRRKRCFCFRPNRNENWLFSRYSTGWKCGLHADWTELTSCVDGELNKIEKNVPRRYFYVTIIRDPVARYLSEFRHVQRGATWRGARHWCAGSQANIPQCYTGSSWEGVTLEQFMACPYNLGNNRQTRMLANLTLVGCYNSSMKNEKRDGIMLSSAKQNLQLMPFFMLTEYQKMGQYTFEETFGMHFAVKFEQHNATLSAATMSTLTPQQLESIRHLNKLDLELYEFAKHLAFERFRYLANRDPHYIEHIQHLGESPSRQSVTEFNWESVIEDTTDND